MKENFFGNTPQVEKRNDTLHPAIEHAHSKTKHHLEQNQINLHDFTELYGRENVQRDLDAVKRKESRFEEAPHKKYAEVLEAIMCDQISHGDWFGENVTATKSSKFDDYFNGSDLILELKNLEQQLSHLSLSVDVTFGTHTEEEKFLKIKEGIDNETLGEIKYFHSEQGGMQGKLTKVPQVVIGVEKDHVIELAGLWAGESTMTALKEKTVHTLKTHRIQDLILSEMIYELTVFRNYAENTDKKSLIPHFEKNLMILENIRREKGVISIGELRDDKVYLAIKESMKMFKTQESK